jgi:hypothetical protein
MLTIQKILLDSITKGDDMPASSAKVLLAI